MPHVVGSDMIIESRDDLPLLHYHYRLLLLNQYYTSSIIGDVLLISNLSAVEIHYLRNQEYLPTPSTRKLHTQHPHLSPARKPTTLVLIV